MDKIEPGSREWGLRFLETDFKMTTKLAVLVLYDTRAWGHPVSYKRLARWMGVSASTARRCVREAEAHGWIKRHPEYSEDGRRIGNSYEPRFGDE